MEIMLAIPLTIACSRFIHNAFILHAHPVRGESHNQRNTTGKVATKENLIETPTQTLKNIVCVLVRDKAFSTWMRPRFWSACRSDFKI